MVRQNDPPPPPSPRVMYDLDWPNRSRRRVGEQTSADLHGKSGRAKLRSRFIGTICIIVKVFGVRAGRPCASSTLLSLSLSLEQTRSILAIENLILTQRHCQFAYWLSPTALRGNFSSREQLWISFSPRNETKRRNFEVKIPLKRHRYPVYTVRCFVTSGAMGFDRIWKTSKKGEKEKEKREIWML